MSIQVRISTHWSMDRPCLCSLGSPTVLSQGPTSQQTSQFGAGDWTVWILWPIPMYSRVFPSPVSRCIWCGELLLRLRCSWTSFHLSTISSNELNGSHTDRFNSMFLSKNRRMESDASWSVCTVDVRSNNIWKTFTEEANFVCQYRLYRSFLATALQIGAMLIFFSGQITDLVGRRRALQLLVGFFLVISFGTQAAMQFLPITIEQK